MSYSQNDFMEDAVKLLTYSHFDLIQRGILSECAFCKATAGGITGFPEQEGIPAMFVAARAPCLTEFEGDMHGVTINNENAMVVPADEARRRELISEVYEHFVSMSMEVTPALIHAPLIFQHEKILKADTLGLPISDVDIYVFPVEGGMTRFAYTHMFPRNGEDHWAIGGKVARDAIAVFKSVEGGGTEVYHFGGAVVMTSSDPDLAKRLFG